VKTRLAHEKREAERAVDESAARQEFAEQSAERERRQRHRRDHPDPRGRLEREEAERQQRDNLPWHVVVNESVGRLRAERDGRPDVTIRIPRVHADQNGRRTGPDSGEIVEVDHLETPAERAQKNDEGHADQDRGHVNEIGAALAGHVVDAMLTA